MIKKYSFFAFLYIIQNNTGEQSTANTTPVFLNQLDLSEIKTNLNPNIKEEKSPTIKSLLEKLKNRHHPKKSLELNRKTVPIRMPWIYTNDTKKKINNKNNIQKFLEYFSCCFKNNN